MLEKSPPRYAKPGVPTAKFPEPSDLAPRSYDLSQTNVVRSLNCTANKPLHLGHLRNLVLGAAVAGSLEMRGARVVRHCILEDTGRFMTEAMAAVREFEPSGATAENVPAKSDHFVGWCYRRYREKLAAARSRAGGKHAAASTGYEARNDDADELMRGLLRGDEAVVGLRDKVRAMALEGQQATLRRLGIAFDSCDYESAEDPVLDEFIAACADRGMLRRDEKGRLVYQASGGRKVPFVNRIGLPEESARLLSFNRRLAETGAGRFPVLIMAGSEWKESMSSYAEVLHTFGLTNGRRSSAHTFYGMVRLNGKKMASSMGSGVLVDDLLDRIAADERIADLARRAAPRAGADELAATVIKAFLLASPRTQPIDFTFERVSGREANPGWAIAEAWTALGEADAVPPTAARETSRIVADALARVSFEHAVRHAEALADEILGGRATPAARNDFRALLAALALVPCRTEFAYAAAGSLLDPRAG